MVGQLFERIRKKDQRAMRELYQRYIGELSSVCYRYVPQRDDAKDVLQNSFVKIFTSLASFDYRGEDAFKGWMRRVVVNEALRFLKERRRMLFVDEDADSLQMLADEEPQAERISADELHRLISSLPEGYRTVMNLYVFEGYSHKQIAELLSIKETTSASQLHHAKRLLAKRIKELTEQR